MTTLPSAMLSVPRIVALNRAGHAARTAAAADELRALEGDDGAVALTDAVIPGEERRAAHDAEAHALELVQRPFVALVRQDHARPDRDEIAARRPLLSLLHRAPAAATEDGLDGHATGLERVEDALAL